MKKLKQGDTKMKVLNKIVLGISSLCLLAACGSSTVSYDKFHEEAVEAAKKENGFTKVVVNGKAKVQSEDGGVKKTAEYTFDKLEITGYTNGRMDAVTAAAKAVELLTDEAKLVAFGLSCETAELVPNDGSCTYYKGLEVKEKDGDYESTIKFDENGLPVSMKFSGEGSGSVTLSWSK